MKKKIGFAGKETLNDGEKKEKLKKEPDPLSYSLLDEFCLKFSPANSVEETTNYFTTAEITKAITSFSGDRNFNTTLVKENLISKRYKYSIEIEGSKLVFKWMIKERL